LRNYLGDLLADTLITSTDWAPNKAKLANVMDALKLDDVPDPDRRLLALQNGMFNALTTELTAPTPHLFVTNYLPYPYDPTATCHEWDRFLASVWPCDAESVALLQEWFGYLVSGSTGHHKALLMVGPPRSGKGTILRVAESLIGQGNTGALKMSNLTSWFGPQTVIGKSLAIIGDLRIDGRLPAAASESLLSITGEDLMNVQRKGMGLEPVDTRMRCRIMAATNYPPIFRDPGGALPTRFLYLVFTETFLGREDTALTEKLTHELSSVLNWAITGWQRLERDGWTVPASSRDIAEGAAVDASPVGQFLEQCCVQEGWIPVTHLYSRWSAWAKLHGFPPGSTSTFGSELKGYWPHVVRKQHRVNNGRTYVYEGCRYDEKSAQ
jgi:putative DNA primase/helicase